MYIIIVKRKDDTFSRECFSSTGFDVKELNKPEVLAYRFATDAKDLHSNPDIYDWNLCSELKAALKPLPSHLTPEILYLFRSEFLNKAVELVENLKTSSDMNDSEIYTMLYRFCTLCGKEVVLFDDKISSMMKKASEQR